MVPQDGVVERKAGMMDELGVEWVKAIWPRPPRDGSKYDRGHAVVVSGGIEATGAARLAARAALRIGAGLVTVASPSSALMVNAVALTAVMVRRSDGAEGLEAILSDSRRNAVVIGPGLEPDEETRRMAAIALAAQRAVVLDAGALTAFAGFEDRLRQAIENSSGRVILTPHEGEFARLFPALTGDRKVRAKAAATQIGAVIVLKGQGTLVASPDDRIVKDMAGPPTLSTAGTGDVLAGFCGGLLAQGLDAYGAAAAAVWMHSAAAVRFGPGLVAEDLESEAPKVLAAYSIL